MNKNTTDSTEGFTLNLNRSFNATCEIVFDAWLNADVVSQWLAPDPGMIMIVEELDATVSGRYKFKMVAADGETFVVTGEYITINRPEQLVFTWAWVHGDDKTEMLITLNFIANSNVTEMQMIHEKLPDQESKDHHNEGWLACFDRLASVADK